MKNKAIYVVGPGSWDISFVNTRDINDGVDVRVGYSSICGTDIHVLNGSLIYYQNGVANYPIVTGHEWCGEYDGQPVVGLCIIGCENCSKCEKSQYSHCENRREVGVVNKNGAHAKWITTWANTLIPIPTLSPTYALVEPLAVCVHALKKLTLKNQSTLVVGRGCIGKLCSEILRLRGYEYKVCDSCVELNGDFDVVLECSGHKDALAPFLYKKGTTILAFGFDYESIIPGELVSNEISLITTLGSNKEDFTEAVEIVPYISMNFFVERDFEEFRESLEISQMGQKVVLNHRSIQ